MGFEQRSFRSLVGKINFPYVVGKNKISQGYQQTVPFFNGQNGILAALVRLALSGRALAAGFASAGFASAGFASAALRYRLALSYLAIG